MLRRLFRVQTTDTAQAEARHDRGAIAVAGTEGKMKGSVPLSSEKRVCTRFATARAATARAAMCGGSASLLGVVCAAWPIARWFYAGEKE